MRIEDFYKNKRILITGNTGFKGSWLSLWLSNLGANVLGYSIEQPVSQPNLYSVISLSRIIKTNNGDIRDFSSLKRTIKKFQPEIIFHMAAQSLVISSYTNPIYTFETNVMGTVNLLEASKSSKALRVIINVTSDKCYENNEKGVSFNENDRLGGLDPYSSSKACSELVSKAYFNSFFLKTNIILANVRAGNVIGGGDWAQNRLIPDIYESLNAKKKIILRNPNALRPWQHVLEPLSGYLKLAKILFERGNFESGNNWNFGPKDSDIQSVEDVIKMFQKLNSKISFEIINESYYESKILKLDISKARKELEWTPIWNLKETIQKTSDWYENHYSSLNQLDLTVRQINEYSKNQFSEK